MGSLGMERQLILEIACLLVTLYATAESLIIEGGEDCQTPDLWEGDCIEIEKCPKLWKLKNSFRSINETEFLEQSRCGNLDSPPMYVCCRFEATDLLPDTHHCGQSFENRNNGGSSTHINEYPWTALITFLKSNGTVHYCGGTLINNRYVLTAAQCLLLQKYNVIKTPVRLGEWDITTDPDCEESKNGQRKYCADPHMDFGIEEFILHPNFTHTNSYATHDIALIRLNRNVKFTDFIQPVCLPVQPRLRVKTYVGSHMISIGWGKTESSTYHAKKQSVYMSGVTLDVCSNRTTLSIPDTHLCAGGIYTGICIGDSGGPLIYQQSVDYRAVYVLVGISSFISTEEECYRNGETAIFTRVGPYMDWILTNLRA